MSIVLAVAALGAAVILLLHFALVLGSVLSLVAERHFVAIEAEIEGGRVSVIVSARNQQAVLPRLLSCLERQNTNRFEIVLVNDRSDDRTGDIMQEFSARHQSRVRLVTLIDDPGNEKPRQRALAAGAASATGDLLLITDADSWVPVDWVRTMCRPFKSHDAGLVFGPVIPGLRPGHRRRGFLELFQGFDHLLRYQYTSGLAGLGFPLGSFSNNIAVRRQALVDVGGFEEMRFTHNVGVPLTGRIRETGRWAVRAVRSRGARVFPTPDSSLSKVIRRRIRWSTGGLVARDSATRRTYSLVVTLLVGAVLLVPASVYFAWPLVLPAIGVLLGMGVLAITAGLQSSPGLGYWLSLLPNLVLFLLFESVVMIVSAVSPGKKKHRRGDSTSTGA